MISNALENERRGVGEARQDRDLRFGETGETDGFSVSAAGSKAGYSVHYDRSADPTARRQAPRQRRRQMLYRAFNRIRS